MFTDKQQVWLNPERLHVDAPGELVPWYLSHTSLQKKNFWALSGGLVSETAHTKDF